MASSVPVLRMHVSWLVCFAVAAVTQLVFVVAHVSGPLAFIVTALTMPLLAVWVGRVRGPRLLVLALLLCWLGDMLGNPRAIGIGQFGVVLSAAAYVSAVGCLIAVFVRDRVRNATAWAGAALFLSSEVLVALELTGRLAGAATAFRLAVLTLYLLGIFLMAIGITNRRHQVKRSTGSRDARR